MGSANKVPIWIQAIVPRSFRRVVPVSGLTGFAITSLRSHNLMEPIDRLELLDSGFNLFLTPQRWGHGEPGRPRRES